MSNGKYTPITSSKITATDETNGYYKVRESTYNGKNLYLVTSDKSIGEVTLKIQENRVDYFATVYPIYGELDRKNGEMRLCSTCTPLYYNSTTTLKDAIVSGIGSIYRTNSSEPYTCYKYYNYYTKSSSVNKAILYDKDGNYITEEVLGTMTVNGTSYPRSVCNYCGSSTCNGSSHFDVYEDIFMVECPCGAGFSNDIEGARAHFTSTHMTKKAARFEFIGWEACEGGKATAKVSGCGTWLPAGYYHTQGLYIISSTETKKSNELKLERELKFTKSVSVTKKWSDNSNAHKTRPTSVTVKLLANGIDTGKTVTLNSSNSWKAKFEDLPSVSDDGNDIVYTVQEVSVTGYTTKITGDQTKGFTITNTLQTVNVPVTKVWDDANNQDGKRTTSITAILKADGTQKETVTLNADNNWTHTFTGWPKYNSNGTAIVYTVDEQTTPPGYTKTVSGNTITNKHIPAVIDIPVTKVWDDANDQDGLRPESIAVALKADGVIKQKTMLSESNNWTETFEDFPKYRDGGIEIVYTVDELITPEGYTKTINGNKITNKHIPEVIDIPVTKIWNDNDNQDGLRPSSITITLYKDGSATDKTLTLSGTGNTWTGTFEGLPKNRDHGTEIKYTVKESGASELAYEKTITGNQTTGYTLTNTLKTIDIPVTKVWNDINNRDELRPDSITVTLYENGTATTKTAQLSESKNWKYTFEDLPEYKNEQKVVYTVQETGVPKEAAQYISEVTGSQDAGYTITNIHYDGYIEITGKVWLDLPIISKGNDRNGTYGNEDGLTEGVKITLKDSKGNAIKSTYTDENGDLIRTDYAIPNKNDGTYTIRVNYDNSNNVYRLYEDAKIVEQQVYGTDSDGDGVYENYAYVEFEYNGIKYTTVANATSGENTSKAKENEDTITMLKENEYTRTMLDEEYSKVEPDTDYPENKNITANTQSIIKSFATYEHKNTIDSTEFIKYCDGNGKYEQTNLEKANGAITTGTHTCPNCIGTGHELKTYDVAVQRIEHVNLGLFKREQPDVAIFSELSKVQVIMNDQEYTYLYDSKTEATEEEATKAYNEAYQEAINEGMTEEEAEQYAKQIKLQVKFQTKDTYVYRGPINPADIAYLNFTNDREMKVLVTYEITVSNSSRTLPVTVHNIINSYDSEYSIASAVKVNSDDEAIKIDYETSNNYEKSQEFNEITLKDLDITANPGKESEDKIVLTYTVDPKEIKGLLNEECTLNNAVEIGSYSTIYGETTIYAEERTGERAGQVYGGYDYNSHPGNAEIEYKLQADIEKAYKDAGQEYNEEKIDRLYSYQEVEPDEFEVEDDTDFAPSFVLCEETNDKGEPLQKTLSGTIWEDVDDPNSGEEGERLGNGKYDEGEAKAQNVKVELYELITDDEGNITGSKLAQIYTGREDSDKKPIFENAVTYTESDGSYAIKGVVTGEYFMKFTYGDDTEKLGHEATTMDGGNTTVNARNYKSTIITDTTIVDIKNGTNLFKKDYDNFSDDEKIWHITHEDGYSVAVDNMLDRLEIEDLQYSNFRKDYTEPQNMTAYTKPFKTQIEFEPTGESSVDAEGNIKDVTNVLDKLDFGIAERPREDLIAQKTINNFRIVLANGQELASGNPNDPNANMNYTKAIGFNQEISNGEQARNALPKRLMVEMDAELIQGARLEVEYSVRVTNNNEIDYDYGSTTDYTDIVDGDIIGEGDKYITKNSKANYYYYGDSNGLNPMNTTIEFIDYIDNELVYKEDTTKWIEVTGQELYNNELINSETSKAVDAGKYKALQSASGASITLPRGEFFEQNMSASKVIANNDENVFDNNAEILKIDGKTARTIQESDGGFQVEKSYKPGNYIPSSQSEALEQDDDKVAVIITPPTGITTYIIPYILISAVGLMVIGVGIIFIKKKILIK